MRENMLLFCATFVTIIISSVYTKQQWSLPYYSNSCRKPYRSISHLNKPTTVQIPVVSSQKIDVPIDKGTKPIYWSTLLPTPVEPEKTCLKPKPIKNYQNYDNLVDQHDFNTLLSSDYYTKLLSEYMNYVNTPVSTNKVTNQLSTTTFRVPNEGKIVQQKTKENREFIKQNDGKERNKIQEHKTNKQKKDRTRNNNDRCNYELKPKQRNNNYNSKLPATSCGHRPVSEKNSEIILHPQHYSKPKRKKKSKEFKSTQCNCQTNKTKRPKKDSGLDPKKLDIDNKELIIENNIQEKVTNFDQMCANLDDTLNINLEYSDHDCKCVRNSRNNESYKKSRKKQPDTPNDFATDYLNLISTHMSNHQFGTFYSDNSYVFPYNFDYLYQMPQSQNKKKNNEDSKDKKAKLSDKSSKKGSKKKSSKKRNKKTSSDKQQIASDGFDTLVELTPTVLTIDFREENPYDTDLNVNQYISDLDSAEYYSLSDNPYIDDIQKNIQIDKNEKFEDNPKNELDELHRNQKGTLIKSQEDAMQNNQEVMSKNSQEEIQNVQNNTQNIQINLQNIQNNSQSIQNNLQDIQNIHNSLQNLQNEPQNVKNNPKNVQDYKPQNRKENMPENSKDILPITGSEYENINSGELIIPLLPDDIYFWDDYYPDFTFENGAYITSSEEEEWENFHKYYYLNDHGKKEILKRNLNKRPRTKSDWTIYSQPRSENRRTELQPNLDDEIKHNVAEFPNFLTRIVNKEDIPHYKDVLLEKREKNNKKAKLTNNNKMNNNYKMKDVETVRAPSKVRNYSLMPSYDDIYGSSEEESEENKLHKREVADVHGKWFTIRWLARLFVFLLHKTFL